MTCNSMALSHTDSQYRASRRIYELCRKIGCGLAGDIFDLPSHAFGSDNGLWESVEDALETGHIYDAASNLRGNTLLVARASFPICHHIDWLKDNGFSREDIRQIRYVVEMFHHIEPIFAIIAALIRRWSCGAAQKTSPRYTRCCTQLSTQPIFIYPPAFVESNEHIPCLEPILRCHSTPIHQFYRAMAIWPEYMQRIWEDLGSCAGMESAITGLDARTDALVSRIPYTNTCDGTDQRIMKWADRCCRVSIEVSLMTSALRHGFTRDEMSARGNLVQKNRLR